jgi:hypothetical protein
LATWIGLFVVGPFLPQAARTYAGHASSVVLIAGIVAAIVAAKTWIAPYMPGRRSDREAESNSAVDKGAIARIRTWNIVVAFGGVAALLLLPRLGLRLDREQIHAAVLGVAVTAICTYYAIRYIRRPLV